MPYYNLKCYLLLKLASHLVRTRTTKGVNPGGMGWMYPPPPPPCFEPQICCFLVLEN